MTNHPAATPTFLKMARPGLMLSSACPKAREKEGETLRAIETGLHDTFFQALQTSDVSYPTERKQIATSIQPDMPYTYSMGRLTYQEKLNLSSLQQSERDHALDICYRHIDYARECGANRIQILGGPAPQDPTQRKKALTHLTQSLIHLADHAAQPPTCLIIVEPLDVQIHKKGTLGYASEVHDLMQKANRPNLGVCYDTAHDILNNEEPAQTLKMLKNWIPEIHICNCVTNQAHPLHGDHHIPLGPPGVLDLPTVIRLFQDIQTIDFTNTSDRPSLFLESKVHGRTCHAGITQTRETFETIIQNLK